MVLGRFAAFHPEVLFNNPDPVITEPWQGGWTTRGMGAFIAVESFLVGLFALQTYLGAAGKSVGKILFGLRVVREKDLGEVSFFRGVLIRSWLFGLAPIIAAAVVTRPFDVRSFLANIPGKVPLLVAAGMVCVAGLVVAIAKGGRGVHDLLAGTRVIRAEPWRVRKVQLGLKTAFDRVVLWQAGRVLVLVLCALIVIAVAVRENWTVAPF